MQHPRYLFSKKLFYTLISIFLFLLVGMLAFAEFGPEDAWHSSSSVKMQNGQSVEQAIEALQGSLQTLETTVQGIDLDSAKIDCNWEGIKTNTLSI